MTIPTPTKINTIEDAWRVIDEHELSVRRLPTAPETCAYGMRHHKPGNTIKRRPINPTKPGHEQTWFDRQVDKGYNQYGDYELTDGQLYRVYTCPPPKPRKRPGWWLLQRIPNTNNITHWDSKHTEADGPTLIEAVQNYLDKIGGAA